MASKVTAQWWHKHSFNDNNSDKYQLIYTTCANGTPKVTFKYIYFNFLTSGSPYNPHSCVVWMTNNENGSKPCTVCLMSICTHGKTTPLHYHLLVLFLCFECDTQCAWNCGTRRNRHFFVTRLDRSGSHGKKRANFVRFKGFNLARGRTINIL